MRPLIWSPLKRFNLENHYERCAIQCNGQHLSALTNAPVQLARRRHDPILEELWAVKAQINAEANHDIHRLVEMARIAAAPYIDENGRVRAPAPATQTPLLPAHEH